MIPPRGTARSTGYHVVTSALVFTNVIGLFWEASWGRMVQQAVAQYALIPGRYAWHPIEAVQRFGAFAGIGSALVPFLSYMFLHASWVHLIGNMWMLRVFGDDLEDKLTQVRFLLFYLAGGIVSGLVHVITNPGSLVPTLGASGAIAAVMGAYFRFFPGALIRAPIIPLLFRPTVPAWVFLLPWFVLQFFYGIGSLGEGPKMGGVAWWAHIGGFAFGFAAAPFCLAAPVDPRRDGAS
jgi:membrane associated rhomboid family serine protease